MKNSILIISNIALPIDASSSEAFSVARDKLRKIGIKADNFCIYKKSIDARNKDNIKFVYSVSADIISGTYDADRNRDPNIQLLRYEEPKVVRGTVKAEAPIVVVGSGPCGLFCALHLARNGYSPILIERGDSIEQRKKSVETFKSTRVLNADSNIQFGAGGAGTFSDGKLITRINDSMSQYVLKTLVQYGAPKEIELLAKPHVGTDILSEVVDNMINDIVRLGGQIRYNTKMTDIVEKNGQAIAIKTNNSDISCSVLVICPGHSARDTYKMLMGKSFVIEAKDFSVGMRIEHSVNIIDRGLYGKFAGHPKLHHAEYNLSYNTKERGVYTFCMCPGGVVVPAASEDGGVVVNGMSYHARDGRNSNSALCCSIFKSDYGNTPDKAIEMQRQIERKAFISAGSDYSAPIITVGDFLNDKCQTAPQDIIPTYCDSMGVKLVDPKEYLPDIVCSSLKNGIAYFDKKINGFAYKNAVLTGPETRTSAPLRILRNSETRVALGYNNIYPAGEGAGYAGGITSAAIDGIKTAMAIISRFTI